MRTGVPAIALVAVIWAAPAEPADLFTPLQLAAACAPLPESSLPGDAPRIVGVQDVDPRRLYGNRDLVIIGAGTGDGIQLDQQYFIRRPPMTEARHTTGPRGASTAGWLRVVAANENTAIGRVEFACDGIIQGDLLQPFAAPALPADADRTDTTGEPDFRDPGRILFGDNERTTAGAGDLLLTDVGARAGAAPGSRFAIYRDLRQPDVPLAAIGEAVVISVEPEFSLIRVTRSRGAVYAGDLLAPRR